MSPWAIGMGEKGSVVKQLQRDRPWWRVDARVERVRRLLWQRGEFIDASRFSGRRRFSPPRSGLQAKSALRAPNLRHSTNQRIRRARWATRQRKTPLEAGLVIMARGRLFHRPLQPQQIDQTGQWDVPQFRFDR